ncbi:hypothetical protein BpHYR1_017090 [Brachionus plicatilis]|uniref:Uncharacterized protein n=1 Tax=Brachionus plicatilis TaxID=10195 RepID=A0A3M7SAR3_BRAPC|nr:hypothetical protein BpHYR1_017090 [Brachionus plicatilis]
MPKFISSKKIKSDLKQDIVRKSKTKTDLLNFFLKFNIPIMNKKKNLSKINSIPNYGAGFLILHHNFSFLS